MTTAARRGMTELDPSATVSSYSLRSRRIEVWQAASTDGVWLYHREEDTGTTWTVLHLPTGRVLPGEVSLPMARRGTADGWTLAELDRRESPAAPRVECSFVSMAIGVRQPCVDAVVPGSDRCRRHFTPGSVLTMRPS